MTENEKALLEMCKRLQASNQALLNHMTRDGYEMVKEFTKIETDFEDLSKRLLISTSTRPSLDEVLAGNDEPRQSAKEQAMERNPPLDTEKSDLPFDNPNLSRPGDQMKEKDIPNDQPLF